MTDALKLTEGFCRACLVKFDDPADLLHYSERNRRLFIYSTGIQVKRNDTFAFQICKDCCSLLKIASNFKKKCRTSDKKIRNFMGLRNAGDDIDFCGFLKNNDDSHTFRLPFNSGNSTPASQRAKDDDNESTCTSIRNFMKDILKEDEILDNEARIIKEVIEEEADISDDSLDSHWFQDEMSINGDITFDFSFSPFSTPKTGNIDRYESPKPDILLEPAKTKEIFKAPIKSVYGGPIKSKINNSAVKTELWEAPEKLISIPDKQIEISNYTDGYKVPTKCPIDKKLDLALKNEDNQIISLDDLLKSPASTELHGKRLPGAETPTINDILFGKTLDCDLVRTKTTQITAAESPTINNILFGKSINSHLDDVKNFQIDSVESCTINNRLVEKTLESTLVGIKSSHIRGAETPKINNILFGKSLDSDSVETKRIKLSGAETPKINNILFGKTLDTDLYEIKTSQIEPDLNILPDENDNDSLNLSHFGLDLNKEKIDEDICEEETEKPTLDEIKLCDKKNLYCKLCDKKFKCYAGLKRHFKRIHQHILPSSKTQIKQTLICDYCGKSTTDRRNFIRHIQAHEKSSLPLLTCSICSLPFTGSHNLKLHMVTHKTLEEREHNKKPDSKFICTKCGKQYSSKQNLRSHMSRHGDNYKCFCKICDIGFFRTFDYKVHARIHSGDKPHQCNLCDMKFTRRDTLNRHYRMHQGILPHKCEYCGKAFVIKSTLNHHIANSKRCQLKRNAKETEVK